MKREFNPIIVHSYESSPKNSCGKRAVFLLLGMFVLSSIAVAIAFKSEISVVLSQVKGATNKDVTVNEPDGEGEQTSNTNQVHLKNINFPPTESPSKAAFPTVSPEMHPSKSPTVHPSKFPTKSPTYFPTKSPTYLPTKSPTYTPTVSPVSQQETSNVESCDKTYDIIFLIDDSSSIGNQDYALIKSAVLSFIYTNIPQMNQVAGTRIGYVEFAQTASELFTLTQSSDYENLVKEINTFSHDAYGSNHKSAIVAAHQMVSDSAKNNKNVERVVLMLTDGNPCIRCGALCCPGSSLNGKGVAELRAFLDEFDFTFYLLPIEPNPGFGGVSLSILDSAIGQIGNSIGFDDSNFIKLPTTSAENMNTYLKSITLPPLC